HPLAVDLHLAAVDGIGGEAAGLVEAGGPQPLVYSNASGFVVAAHASSHGACGPCLPSMPGLVRTRDYVGGKHLLGVHRIEGIVPAAELAVDLHRALLVDDGAH